MELEKAKSRLPTGKTPQIGVIPAAGGIQKVDYRSGVKYDLPEVTVWIPGFAEDDGAQDKPYAQ